MTIIYISFGVCLMNSRKKKMFIRNPIPITYTQRCRTTKWNLPMPAIITGNSRHFWKPNFVWPKLFPWRRKKHKSYYGEIWEGNAWVLMGFTNQPKAALLLDCFHDWSTNHVPWIISSILGILLHKQPLFAFWLHYIFFSLPLVGLLIMPYWIW